jgi:hypothetical protein
MGGSLCRTKSFLLVLIVRIVLYHETPRKIVGRRADGVEGESSRVSLVESSGVESSRVE